MDLHIASPLSGKCVIITGAARGIGFATAAALNALGARLVLGDLDGDLVASQASRLSGIGLRLDVTDESSFSNLVDIARQQTGQIDVLINNAGIMPTGPFLSQPAELAELMFAVNVHGVARGTRLVLPDMLGRRHGQIINLASVAGRSPAAGMVSYCATKHAVVGMTRALRREHHGSGVRFTTVMPSFTNTRLVVGADSRLIPVAEPEQIAAAIAQVVVKPRDEVIVPRLAAVMTHAAERLLPLTVSDAVARRLGADEMFLRTDGSDRGVGWSQRAGGPPAMNRPATVAIVGAGFGGLAAAIELKRHCINSFTVLERADRVGGVWQANHYPGAACDVPSVIYQFSFALKPDWSRRFGTQREIRNYLHQVAEEEEILPHVRFGTEVTSAEFDQHAGSWIVSTADGDSERYDVLICATGQLSRPKIPDVAGRETFVGAQFHSAEWDHKVDLAGKRVVVVGGGASAIQVVPAIVDTAAHVSVVQRSPSWVSNKYDWTPGRVERTLMRSRPAQRIYHNLMWLWFESRYPITKRASRPLRWLIEQERKATIRRIVKDPQKIAAATPDYQIGCNRILLSRAWYPTLARPDVSVRRASVAAMDAHGVVCDDGSRIDADVVVWCTGFTPSEYLAPMKITGLDGQTIREAWAEGPEAYLGLATPGFPNLFMSYGPNTGSLTNTIIYLLERQARYMRQAVQYLGRSGGALEVRRETHDAFNAELQERLQHTVFTTGCPGWYTTDAGKVTAVWSGSHVEYGRRTNRFVPAAYHHSPSVAPAPEVATEVLA